MDRHHLARVLAVLRIVIGVVAIAAPATATRPLLGALGRDARSKLLTRAFGVRDVALGLGTLRALQENRDPAAWVQLSALCDASDALATVAGLGQVPLVPSLAALVSSSTAAATGFAAAREIGRVDAAPAR